MRDRELAACFATLWLAASLTGQRTPETRLNTSPPGTEFAWDAAIAAAGEFVYVIWRDDRDQAVQLGEDLRLNRSTDGGATWLTTDVRLNTGPIGSSRIIGKDIAAEGSAVYVVWGETRNGQAGIFFNRSLDGGATWLAMDVQVDTTPGASSSPRRAVSGTAIYVTWQDNQNGQPDTYFNRSLDGGSTWLPSEVRLDTDAPGAAGSQEQQIAAAGFAVYVLWFDGRNNRLSVGDDIYFNRSLDGGTTWLESDVRLDTDPTGSAESYHPQIAVAGSTVCAVWQDHRNGSFTRAGPGPADIYCNLSTDQGTTWLDQDVRINHGPAGRAIRGFPSLAAVGSTVFVAWEDARNADHDTDIYFNRSLDGGSTWLPDDVRLDTAPPGAGSGFEKLVATPALVTVLWHDGRNGGGRVGPDLYSNRSLDAGSTWLGSDVRMNVGTQPGTTMALGAIAASGSRVSVAWYDERNSIFERDVFFTVPFGLLPYGSGKAGTGGFVPSLTGSGSANLGQSFALDMASGLGGATAALLVGDAKAALPLLGGTILVAPLIAAPVVLGGAPGSGGAGSLSLPFELPVDEAFVSVPVLFQVLVLDPNATGGVSMSNGVELWIG